MKIIYIRMIYRWVLLKSIYPTTSLGSILPLNRNGLMRNNVLCTTLTIGTTATQPPLRHLTNFTSHFQHPHPSREASGNQYSSPRLKRSQSLAHISVSG